MALAASSLTDPVSKILAIAAIALQVAVAALLVLWLLSLVSSGARALLADVRWALRGRELWIAWGIALTATLGSLFFSEVSGFIPCRLCWYQRIAMYPLAVLLLVGALRRDRRAAAQYALALPVVGAGVSIYHLYIEANPSAESPGCKIGAPCSTKWIDVFGYATIPLLALTAFVAIAALLVLVWGGRDGSGVPASADPAAAAIDPPTAAV